MVFHYLNILVIPPLAGIYKGGNEALVPPAASPSPRQDTLYDKTFELNLFSLFSVPAEESTALIGPLAWHKRPARAPAREPGPAKSRLHPKGIGQHLSHASARKPAP